MTAPKARYGEYVGFRLTKKLDKRLETYCEKRGLYRAQVIRWAVEEYLNKEEKTKK